MDMSHSKTALAPPREQLSGPRSMARSFGSEPLLSSDSRGWRDLAVCVWRVDVDVYDLPPIPEMFVVLHTGGPVQYRQGRSWSTVRSFPGQVTLIPPGTPGSFRRGGTLSGITMHLSMRRLADLLGQKEADRAVHGLRTRIGMVDPFLISVANSLAEELRDPTERGPLYADAMADAVGLHVIRRAGSGDDLGEHGGALAAQALRRVRERIESSIETGISLTELSREVGLSRYQFSRAFQRATGLPPYRYLTERRIERAKVLLRFSDLPLAEVALECGFSSQAHFGDRFQARVGVSPGRYRRGG